MRAHRMTSLPPGGREASLRALLPPWPFPSLSSTGRPEPSLRAARSLPGLPPRGARRGPSLLAAALLLLGAVPAFAVPPGTVITNVAGAAFTRPSGPAVALSSNPVTTVTLALPTPALIEALAYAPGSGTASTVSPTSWQNGGGVWNPLPAPAPPASGPLSLASPVPLLTPDVFHRGDPIFIRLTDPDQDLDPAAPDMVTVTVTAGGDTEILLLTETGPSTGVFTGYLPTGTGTATARDGVLSAAPGTGFTVAYSDPDDGNVTATRAGLLDPYGIVFDTVTGAPVDGARVTLFDDLTGLPAVIYGDDGVSLYPTTVVSGGTATDSGGAVYAFPAGGFRFPYVDPGTYRALVVPPAGFAFPSAIPFATLQGSFGGTRVLEDPASLGGSFTLVPGPAFRFDLPLDVIGGGLLVTKTALRDSVEAGGFVPYLLTVRNTSGVAVSTAALVDRMPPGFRYQAGTLRIDGVPAPDPLLYPDGRTLAVSLPALAAGATVEVRCVALVGPGSRPGRAVNSAIALAGALVSNTAQAAVEVEEDLFRTRALLMGKVAAGSCGDLSAPGLPGVRLYLEDGTSTVTDREGLFHFAAVRPGTHVVQIDTATLPAGHTLTECGERTRSAGRPFSRFVDVQGGTTWRVDFFATPPSPPAPAPLQPAPVPTVTPVPAPPLPAPAGTARLELSARLVGSEGRFTLTVTGTAVPLTSAAAMVELPPALVFVPGSVRVDGTPAPDPSDAPGFLVFRLPDAPEGRQTVLTFTASSREDWSVIGEEELKAPLETRAVLLFDSPTRKGERTALVKVRLLDFGEGGPGEGVSIQPTPVFDSFGHVLTEAEKEDLRELAARLKAEQIVRVFATGHTDTMPIAGRSRYLFEDNYELSYARAQGVARYLGQLLNLPPFLFQLSGRGPDQPVASNDTGVGKAKNRRVELRLLAENSTGAGSSFLAGRAAAELPTLGLAPLPALVATTVPVPSIPAPAGTPAPTVTAEATAPEPSPGNPASDLSWLETAAPGWEMVWPPEGFHPPIPSLKVAVKHDPTSRPTLTLNGAAVSPFHFMGTQRNQRGTVAASVWFGLDLVEGDNEIVVTLADRAGKEAGTLRRLVHYSSPPVEAELEEGSSRLVADGRTPPVVAIRLTDAAGHPAREGVVGEVAVDPPFRLLQDDQARRSDPLTRLAGDRSRFVVGKDGVALVELAPTTRSGEAVVRVSLQGGTREVRAWLAPEEREWVLVGMVEGSAAYKAVSGFLESLPAEERDEELVTEGRASFFARGRVKGKWLLTLAYDTARREEDEARDFGRVLDPDRYYTLYGDGAAETAEAPSSRKLYLKIERDRFYALFGDAETGLSVTELGRYRRSFTGLKTEWKGKRGSFTGFAAETASARVRDELRGDGTSGLYRLSSAPLIENTDLVAIEARDRFHSEQILSRRELRRHLDYEIDPLAGTLYFKEPVAARDDSLNPVWIVAEYETETGGPREATYGGRGAVRLGGGAEVGATFVHQGGAGQAGDLAAVDADIPLGKGTTLRLEAATTDNQSGSEGDAYLVELSREGADLSGKATLREQEAGFGLGQQSAGESGSRKAGLEGRYRLDKRWTLTADASWEENLGDGNRSAVMEAGAEAVLSGVTLGGVLRQVEEETAGGASSSFQAGVSASGRAWGNRLKWGLSHDQELSGEEVGEYPTRTEASADYALSGWVSLTATTEFTTSDSGDTSTSKVGLRALPWEGGTATASLEDRVGEEGNRLAAVYGLRQTVRLGSAWSLEASFERSEVVDAPPAPLFDGVASTSGDGDYWTLSAGAGYRKERLSANLRFETREGEELDKRGVVARLVLEPFRGLSLGGSLDWFEEEDAGGRTVEEKVRLAAAYRPRAGKIILLDRFDLSRLSDGAAGEETRKLVNNATLNWRPAPDIQWSFLWGLRLTEEEISGSALSSHLDLLALEGRHDLGDSWDVGARLSLLRSADDGTAEYGAGASLGWLLADNLWVSFGYNFAGFEAPDFTDAEATSAGPFVKLRWKFDQLTAREAIRALGLGE